MDSEFEVGDEVTFKPYERAIAARVVAVSDRAFFHGPQSDRVFYRLAGAKKTPLLTVTTGRSIVESKLFEAANCQEVD